MKEQIAQAVKAGIGEANPDAGEAEVAVEVDGNRALITVVSSAFESMSRVQKQQAVYACIDDYISDGRLHAVTIRALTPAEAAQS